MRKFILTIFLILSITSVIQLKAQETTFKVSAPRSVVVGTRFQIQYTVNADNSSNIRLSQEFADLFNVLMDAVSNSSSTVIDASGKVTRVINNTYTYTVIAKKEGTFTIGPATIKVGNSEYKSDPFTINVLPPDQAAQTQQQGRGAQEQGGGGGNAASSSDPTNSENLFMRAIVSKRNVFEQEGFLVTFKIYSINQMYHVVPKYPEFEGFHIHEIDLKSLEQILENYNGRNYYTVIVRQVILFPINSGKLVIGSGKVDVTLRVTVPVNSRSIFGLNIPQDITREVVSEPFAIEAKPLPPGKPANFSNTAGSYTMTSEINRTQLKANEAVTIKLTIRGTGNIKALKNPEVKFPNDFEVFEPKQDNSFRVSTTGVTGTRTIEYTAIPRYAGDFEIPPITFSYFDLPSGAYKTLSTEAFKLQVERDENSASAPLISNFSGGRESLRFLGKDIRYLKTQKISFQLYKDIFFGSFLYIMAYLMLTVLFVAFFVIYRKQVKENANIALVRTKKANKTAVKRLKQAEKLLKENKEEAFYEEVLRALWGYLSDKLNIPQSELTKDNVASELKKNGVEETLTGEFMEIIHTCEFARYAPSKTSGAMDKLFRETINAIDTMENTIKK